ncbi:hypothetical protein AX769_05645 [Frondihabitans sp. PAMC 28766]|nr:hypothetical protein AX769_05645 [Frondihabitans sp. PAMC 28766]
MVSDFSAAKMPSGTPTPITSTTNDGKTFSTSITPTGIIGDRSIPIKYGKFSTDEGRLHPKDFIAYHVDTPMGPSTSTTIADSVPSGQNWTFDCSTVGYVDQTIAANNSIAAQTPVTPTAKSCTRTSLTATLPAVAASHIIVLTYSTSLLAATGDAAPQTFVNQAVVTTTAGGVTTSADANASNVQSSGGGTGVGVNAVSAVSITKGDADGNAADTDLTAATLPVSGQASLVYRITNTGADALTNVAVTDQVLANGTVTGLSCDFSAFGGSSTGTTFTGRFPAGASFPCTSALSGVSSTGPDHHDVGTVTATGVVSGTAVTASNDYFAKVTPGAAGTPPTGGNAGTPNTGTPVTGGGTGTGPGTPTGGNSGPGTTTATPVTGPVAPAATGTTPLADSSSNGTGSLAFTGSNVEAPLGLAGGLLALGALLTVLGVLRRRRAAE